MDTRKLIKSNILLFYALFQTIILFFLRKLYLMTVYQTVITYLLISIIGLFIIYISQKRKSSPLLNNFKNVYLLVWSSFHGVIILGLLTCGSFYLTITQINIIQIVNIFLGFTIYWVTFLIVGRYITAIVIGNAIIGVVGILNHNLCASGGRHFRYLI